VIVQLPVAKILEWRRRMAALAVTGFLFAGAWLIVLGGGAWFHATAAVAIFAAAACVIGVGECLHGAVQNPLIADLAPEHLLGRYMAVRTIGWQLGFVAGPAIGGFFLDQSPNALWIVAAGACALAAFIAFALEARLPREARFTPGLAPRLSG
jgi:MFS family permease